MARIVVAGAGAVGASIAYHLALLGAREVVLCDRAGVADVREGIRELADQLGVERVPPLRLRECDPKHVAVALDPEAGHPVSLEFAVC